MAAIAAVATSCSAAVCGQCAVEQSPVGRPSHDARFRMTVKDKATGALAFDGGDLSDGQSVDMVWPSGTFTISTTAKSGVSGVELSVRADLRAVPAVTQAANQGCV